MRHSRFLSASVALSIVLASGLVACSGEAPTPSETKTDAPAQVTSAPPVTPAAPAKVTPAPPAPAPKSAVASRPAVIKNGDFESIVDGVPEGWEVKPKSILTGETTAKSGNHSLCLTGDKKEMGFVSQALQLMPDAAGKTVKLTGFARAAWGGQLTIELIYISKSKGEQSESTTVDAGEDWSEIALEAKLPADTDTELARVRITLRPGAKYMYQVDGLKVSVE